jgi:L-fuculose-phosphate aldolase
MEIPKNIREYIKKSDAILLENHGTLTLGSDLLNAYHKMETLEHTASIFWKAIQLGNVNVLPEKERERLMALRPNYGLTGPLITCDTTPLPGNSKLISGSGKIEISEQTINEFAEKVINKLKQK